MRMATRTYLRNQIRYEYSKYVFTRRSLIPIAVGYTIVRNNQTMQREMKL